MVSVPERLRPVVREILEDGTNDLALSAASSWEIAIKYALGRLPLPQPPDVYVPEQLAKGSVRPLRIEHTHALHVASLPRHHKDPFDRLLIAQAQVEGMTVITADRWFRAVRRRGHLGQLKRRHAIRGSPMAIDFTLPPDIEEVRLKVRTFIDDEVRPRQREARRRRGESTTAPSSSWRSSSCASARRRSGCGCRRCRRNGAASASARRRWPSSRPKRSRASIGPYVLNCHAPDEGNMHTLLHFGTDEQKQKYLKPLCEGFTRSCFSMTEPEVAGLRPDRHPDDGRGGRRRLGHRTDTSGSRPARAARTSRSSSRAPIRTP